MSSSQASGRPNRCTASTARVRVGHGVVDARRVEVERLRVDVDEDRASRPRARRRSRWRETCRPARAPRRPRSRSSASTARWSAAVPDETATACSTPHAQRELGLELGHLRAHGQLARLEHLGDRRQLLGRPTSGRASRIRPAPGSARGTRRSSSPDRRRARPARRSRAPAAPCRRSGSAARRRCSGAAGNGSRRGQPVSRWIAGGEVVDRHRGARVADVEALAERRRVLEAEERTRDHVVDVAPRTDLRAVAVDDEVATFERRLDEGADRAAADLARAVDVERAHGHERDAVLVVVGAAHVLAGELRDRVRPPRLADRALRRHVRLVHLERVRAEDLARRELDHALDGLPCRERRLEHVVGADHVHAHRPHGALEHGVDAGDRGAVDDVGRAGGELADEVGVEDVAAVEGEARVLASSVPESASRWRLSSAITSFASTSRRASVVPMNPAPPVIRIRFPSRGIGRV